MKTNAGNTGMNEVHGGASRAHELGGAEGRLLALFRGRPDAATSVGAALRLHGAENIAIEAEWVDGLQAIRATWPITDASAMNEPWLNQVVRRIDPRGGDRIRANLGAVRRVGIFVSRSDHCLADLLQRNWSGTLPCEVAFVASNHEDCRGLAELFGVPFHFFDMRSKARELIEAEQLALLERERVHLIVLARYMQILSPAFVAHYPGRIINIHHALLPAFEGADPYRRAVARGVKFIGATAHYVTADLDAGPIIEQEVLRVTHRDDPQALRKKGAELERITLARAVKLHVDDRVLPVNDRVVVFDGHATHHDAMLEGLMQSGRVDAGADHTGDTQHWLTTEWPMLELQRSLPDVFPGAGRHTDREVA
ncbi:MAG: formyltetrahydrofolate deformylase [Sphingomicrobium sp.]